MYYGTLKIAEQRGREIFITLKLEPERHKLFCSEVAKSFNAKMKKLSFSSCQCSSNLRIGPQKMKKDLQIHLESEGYDLRMSIGKKEILHKNENLRSLLGWVLWNLDTKPSSSIVIY